MVWAEKIRPTNELWSVTFLERLYDAFCVLSDGTFVRLRAAGTVVIQKKVYHSNGELEGLRNSYGYRMIGLQVTVDGCACTPPKEVEFIIDPDVDVVASQGGGCYKVFHGDGRITVLTMAPYYYRITEDRVTPPLLELLVRDDSVARPPEKNTLYFSDPFPDLCSETRQNAYPASRP